MREISAGDIINAVSDMCGQSNIFLPTDIKAAINDAAKTEPYEPAKAILNELCENIGLAEGGRLPVCQDTGMAIVFLELGQEVHITGGELYLAVNEGIKQGYDKHYLRKSVVRDPLRRENTGDNTPAIIYSDIVPGEQLKITLLPKGFGSENMSRQAMLKPSDGEEGVCQFVLETVRLASGNPCPPIVVGVGVGGSFEYSALLSKRALLRPLNEQNPDEYYANMEKRLLDGINRTGIGPGGFGGRTTALGVSVLSYPTHIAGLPVAVNISCHVTRHVTAVL